jgi:hypothetical protein
VVSNTSRHLAEALEKSIARHLLGLPQLRAAAGYTGSMDFSRLTGVYALGPLGVSVQLHDNGLMTTTPTGRIVHLLPKSPLIFVEADDPSTCYHFEITDSSRNVSIRRFGKTIGQLTGGTA